MKLSQQKDQTQKSFTQIIRMKEGFKIFILKQDLGSNQKINGTTIPNSNFSIPSETVITQRL